MSNIITFCTFFWSVYARGYITLPWLHYITLPWLRYITLPRTCCLYLSRAWSPTVTQNSNSSMVRERRLLSIRRRWLRRTASARLYGSLFRPSKMSSSAPLYTSSCCSSFFSCTSRVLHFSSLITASYNRDGNKDIWVTSEILLWWWENWNYNTDSLQYYFRYHIYLNIRHTIFF